MKKRIFYSILMTLLLVTGCYKDEFGQIQKEIKNLQDSQIAPLEQQLKAIQKSHSELNILSDELREYVALLEEASKELEGNIGKINEKIQDLRQALNDKNVKEKGEVLARLENAKTYLEGQLSTMKSTVDVLKEKYDGIQSQMDAMDALLADKYASKDWVNGTFATIEQQNALIAEVEAVKVLANELTATVLKIESDVKTYMAELRESTLGTVDSSISAQVGELATAYESAIGTVVANVTAAFNAEIESAINTSESGIMSWVDEALKDYLTTAEAEAKLAFYKGCVGAVPDGESLQSQIDDLGALIDGIKPEIEAAYKEAIKKAIEESEGKLTKELTGEIESIKLNELKLLTDGVSELGDNVTKLWEDLGKLEDRIKTLEDQVAAINTTLAVILGETAPTLEEYISALNDELRGNDDARTAYLKNLVADLQNAVDGKDNDKSLQSCIEDIKTLLGTLPAGETSIVEWVQSSKSAIDLQLKSYATIAYVDGLRHEIDSATTDHSNRLDIISGRLSSAIEDSKTTICSWISEALADYMRGADFDAKLQTLVEKYEDLFSKGDQGLQNQIDALSISVRSAIAELQEAYKTKIDTCITEYNSYVVDKVDKKYKKVKEKLDADSTKFDALEATIDGMKNDVKALNVSIDSLRDIVDSLQKFVLDKDYPSLKDIVRDFDAKLKGLTGIYANLAAFNAANEAVNKVGGYKESIEKLADFKKRLEEAEAAIANYKNLAKDFDLNGETLKTQFDALNKELSDLKTAVFGGTSLRKQMEAIEDEDRKLAESIDKMNATLLSRLQSYTSIAFRPVTADGSASFDFNGEQYSSTLSFDVRPKALSASIASAATIMYVSSPTRSLVNLFKTDSKVTNKGDGVLEAVVTLPGNLSEVISKGMSLALFAKGTGFDFASEFIPVSGDRMFLSNSLITCDGYGTRTDVSIRVWFPDKYRESELENPTCSGNWVHAMKNTESTGTKNGLRYVDCTVSVDASNDKDKSRNATVKFSVGKLTCTLTIIQDPREIQEFVNFNPADGKIKFSWKGYVIDTLTNIPTDQRSQTITVTTGDALTDWKVEKNNTSWVSVSHDPDLDKLDNKAVLTFEPGNKNANYNQSGTDKTGYLTFTSATESVFQYSFTQLTRPQQRLEFDPDTTVGLSFDYGKTEKNKGQKTFTVKALDGEYDEYGWTDSKGDYNWINYEVSKNGDPRTVTVWTDANPDTTARTGYISFMTKTGMNDTTYLYPIHQEAAPKQSFTFGKVTSGLVTHNYDVGADGLIHIYQSGGSNNYVYVKGVPSDSWTMRMKNSGTWLTREDPDRDNTGRTRAIQSSDFDYIIHLTAGSNNNVAPRVDTIVFTMKNGGAEYFYEVWQDGREPYRFTDLSDKEYDYKGQTSSFDVTTDPSGNKDWNVKVLDTLGNDVTSQGDFWLKVSNSNNGKASLTLTENGPEKDRKAKVIFYTFEGIDAESADTITVTQTKKPAQTFTFSVSDYSTDYCYIGSEDGLIHVKNGGNDLIYVIVTGYPNNSDWTVTYPSNSWISRNGGNSNGRNVNGDHNYIRFKADKNDSGVRTADLTFNVDGKSYTYKVYQDARPEQRLTFDPTIESGGLSFGGSKTTNDSGSRKVIGINSSDGKYDYGIEIASEYSWLHFGQNQNKNEVRVWTDANPDLEKDRTGYITFTTKGQNPVTCSYPVHQDKGVKQSFTFERYGSDYDDYVYIDDDGFFHVKYEGRTNWYIRVKVTGVPDNDNWTVKYPDSWIHNSTLGNTNGRNGDGSSKYIQFTADKNTGGERDLELVFTVDNKDYPYKVYQDAYPAQTFTFSPANGLIFATPAAESNRRIDVTPDPETAWNVELVDPNNGWLSCSRGYQYHMFGDDEYWINLSVTQNDGKQRTTKIRITYGDGQFIEKDVTQASRAQYTFNLSDKSYDYTAKTPSFNVVTDPSDNANRDWNVKVLDMDDSEVGGDFWLKAENKYKDGKVYLTLSQNGTEERKAQLLFYTFEGETAASAKKITITQTARPPQTFKSITPSIDGNEFSYSPQSKEITVTTNDGLNDYTVAVSGTGVSYTKAENKVTLSLSENTSGGVINGSITFTPWGGGAPTVFNFTQKAKPSHFNLTFDETSWNPGYAGGQKDISVTSDPAGCADWEVESSATWLTATKNASGGLTLVAEENTEYSQRTATVSFSGPSYVTGTNTITVTQAKLITLEFGLSSLSWNGDETDAKTVEVICRPEGFTDWDVSSSNDWFIVSKVDDATVTVKPKGKNSNDLYTPDAKNAIISFSQSDKYKSLNHVECIHNGSCLAAGTRITMANGSTKKIEDIVEGDLVRTFNHEKGQMDAARICLTYKGGSKATPLTLSFASGKKLSIVGTHDLLSQDTRKYVRINRGNVASFVGKSFYNAESGQWDKLIGYKIDTTPVDYYCIYTTNHLNCIAEGMLTVPDDVDYFLNIYELDANLKADLKQLAADIKQYGLMDPRKDYPQYPELQALGESLLCKYLYIALAKGYITEEEFTMLLEAFVARWS